MAKYAKIINLTKIKPGTRRAWPWRHMDWDDTCDVYGSQNWRKHASATAGAFGNVHRPDMRLRSTTLTDTNGVKFLRITAQHRLAKKLPALEPRVVHSRERVALMAKLQECVDRSTDALIEARVFVDAIAELDTAARTESHPEEMRTRKKLHEAAAPETPAKKAARLEEQRLIMAKQMTKSTPFIKSNWDE